LEYGARGTDLFLLGLLLLVPVWLLVIFWKMHFAPPDLAPFGTDVLGINK
jgi:hypothetical protein